MEELTAFDLHVLAALRNLGSGRHRIRPIMEAVLDRGEAVWPLPSASCDGLFCMTGCWHDQRVSHSLSRLERLRGLVRMDRDGGSCRSPRVYSLAG